MLFLYNHGGSANHGCEALVRTAGALFENNQKPCLFSDVPQQDYHYGLHEMLEIRPAAQAVSRLSGGFVKAYVHLKRTGDYFLMDVLPYRKSIFTLGKDDVEISVGGDIYCYEDYPKYIKLHELITKQGCKSILLGCSLEKRLFEDPAAEYLPLPEGFQENNTVGLNLSPLAAGKESRPGIALANYRKLVQLILNETDCAVALIPHVVWDGNDDRDAMRPLLEEFQASGRVMMIPDCNCMQLKGYIARCRYFIGARTHATIAAYSSGVPTLVLGYSLKSRGIATDLFGTDEHYVLPVQQLREENDLCEAFRWIMEREAEIKERLQAVMPEYIERVEKLKTSINEVLGNR